MWMGLGVPLKRSRRTFLFEGVPVSVPSEKWMKKLLTYRSGDFGSAPRFLSMIVKIIKMIRHFHS